MGCLAAVTATAGCATAPAPSEPVARDVPGREEFARLYASCDARPVLGFRGEQLNEEVLQTIKDLSKASSVRVAGPQMDISARGVAGRLTVEVDRNGKILHFYCE